MFAHWEPLHAYGRERTELGCRDMDGRAERPSERARTSQKLWALFLAGLLARTVFDGATLGFGYRVAIFCFVHSKLGRHAGFFVKHFPDRGRLVPTVFLIGERLEGAVQGTRKGDCNGRGFLVPHAADRVRANLAEQENSTLALGYGADGSSRLPLDPVIAGGLVIPQLITPYITPVIYLALEWFQENVLDRVPFLRSGHTGITRAMRRNIRLPPARMKNIRRRSALPDPRSRSAGPGPKSALTAVCDLLNLRAFHALPDAR
jgi:hypothetical protein